MIKPSLTLENRLWAEGFRVVGADEAGRGTWAGSLWVGAVRLQQRDIPVVQEMIVDYNLRDSKQMTPKQRARIYRMILETGIRYSVADATVGEVDVLGIEKAFGLALNRAGAGLADSIMKTVLLVDGARYKNLRVADRVLSEPLHFEIVAEDKLDQTSATVALASVVAKVHQSITMLGLNQLFPEYGFSRHNGYPTKEHRAAVAEHGLSAVHRTS